MTASRPLRILVVGAGGHGRVVADALIESALNGAPQEIVGFLDDDPTLWEAEAFGVPVLGPISAADDHAHDGIVVAIGDNATRKSVSRDLLHAGERIVAVIHPRAVVARDAVVGEGVVVFGGAVVNTGVELGRGAIINTGCSVDHHNRIGEWAHIAPGAHLGGDVTIGAGAVIGVGAAVTRGRTVGAWSMVGTGAAVTEDIPPHVVAVGVPARVVRLKAADGDLA